MDNENILTAEMNALFTKQEILDFVELSETEFDDYLKQHSILLPSVKSPEGEKYYARDARLIVKAIKGITHTNRIAETLNNIESKDVTKAYNPYVPYNDTPHKAHVTVLYDKIKMLDSAYYVSTPKPISKYKVRQMLGNISKTAVDSLVESKLITIIYRTNNVQQIFFEQKEIEIKAPYIRQLLKEMESNTRFLNRQKITNKEVKDLLHATDVEYNRWKRKGLLRTREGELVINDFDVATVQYLKANIEHIKEQDYKYMDLQESANYLGFTEYKVLSYITTGVVQCDSKVEFGSRKVYLFERSYIEHIGYLGLGLPKEQCDKYILINSNTVPILFNMRYAQFQRWVELGALVRPLKTIFGLEFYTEEYVHKLQESKLFDSDTIGIGELRNLWGLTEREIVNYKRNGLFGLKVVAYVQFRQLYEFYSKAEAMKLTDTVIAYRDKERYYNTIARMTFAQAASKLHIELNELETYICTHNIDYFQDMTNKCWLSDGTVNAMAQNIGYLATKKEEKNQAKATKSIKKKVIKDIKKVLSEKQYKEPTIEYVSAKEIAEKWGVQPRTVCAYCSSGIVEGAKKVKSSWQIPSHLTKPKCHKVGVNKYVLAT